MQVVGGAVRQRQHGLQQIGRGRRRTLVRAARHVAEIEQRELRREQHAVGARHHRVVREVVADLAQQLRAIDEVAAEPAILMEDVVDRAQVARLDRLAQVVVEEPDAQAQRVLVVVIVAAAGDHAGRVGERRHGVVRAVEGAQEAVLDLLQALHLEPRLVLGQHLERLVGEPDEVRAVDLEPLLRHPRLVLVVVVEHALDRPRALGGDVAVVAVERLDDDRADLVDPRRHLDLRVVRIERALGDLAEHEHRTVAQPDDEPRRIDEPHHVEEVRQQDRPAEDRHEDRGGDRPRRRELGADHVLDPQHVRGAERHERQHVAVDAVPQEHLDQLRRVHVRRERDRETDGRDQHREHVVVRARHRAQHVDELRVVDACPALDAPRRHARALPLDEELEREQRSKGYECDHEGPHEQLAHRYSWSSWRNAK